MQLVGCSHHETPLAVRERLAFQKDQIVPALCRFRDRFPRAESVLISTCNRVELFTAARDAAHFPPVEAIAEFLAGSHGLRAADFSDAFFLHAGADAVQHVFIVAAGLDSMVLGEAQILSQVKQAYELACTAGSTGPLTNAVFQAALRVAKRVTCETAIQQRRVSIPSIAVADFAKQVFDRFDDKHVVVVGAGEMAEETLQYLIAEGARRITIVNRSLERARRAAERFSGVVQPWEQLMGVLVDADVVIGTASTTEPVVTAAEFAGIHAGRLERPLFMLDLAVPRDFDPAIGGFADVYLFSLDDLKKACEANRRERERQWPKAQQIIESEAHRFMAELAHRSNGSLIRRLRDQAACLRDAELERLFNKLADLDARSREEIAQAAERLVNKLLHPPLEALRADAAQGSPLGLCDSLQQLFRLP